MGGRTPRYLECQFEERSEPVSVDAGMLLLGGGVGMVGEVLYLVSVVWCVVYLVVCFDCHMRMDGCLVEVPANLDGGGLGPYPNMVGMFLSYVYSVHYTYIQLHYMCRYTCLLYRFTLDSFRY